MVAKTSIDIENNNKDSYDDLLVSIEASAGMFSLLIAVCDDSNLREEIITKYETKISSDIRAFRLTLPRGEPSLKTALTQLVENNEYLQNGGKAVVTVTGTEQLYFLKLGAEKSEQEIFFGYLQWTREALQEFSYPIVLWVTNQMLVNLSKKAPDFWSWRKGVFRFISKKTNAIPGEQINLLSVYLEDQNLFDIDKDNHCFLPIEDLKALIAHIEQHRGIEDSSLATLYARAGQIYKKRLEKSEAQNYLSEQTLAIEYFQKAANLQTKLDKSLDLLLTLSSLAVLYHVQGRYQKAKSICRQALQLLKNSLLGKEYPNVADASSLNCLAVLFYLQDRYQEAEPLFIQVIETTIKLKGRNHPDVATSFKHLALLYQTQGRYQEAEPLYKQALAIEQNLLGESHLDVAYILQNLAELYNAQGRYEEAESLYMQVLEIRIQLLGKDHPEIAASLKSLASLYFNQGRYKEAKPIYMQSLKLFQHLLGEKHPDIASILSNLALISQNEGHYQEAANLYLQALQIYDQELSVNHPLTITIRKNLETILSITAYKVKV